MNAEQLFFKSICNGVNEDKKAITASKLLYLFDYSRYEFNQLKDVSYNIYCKYNIYSGEKDISFTIDDLPIKLETNDIEELMTKDKDDIIQELIKNFIQTINEKLLELGLVRILSKILIKEEN